MSDEPLAPVLRSWLRRRDVPPPDSARTAAHVLARLPRIRRRGRWWLVPTLRRRSDAAIRGPESQPPTHGSPIVRFPIVTGRTQTMLSPVKAVVGALVFALGGLFLVAQPFDQPEVAVPGAEIWAQPPVAASVAQECVDIFATPVVCTWTASDPRLTGAMTHEWATPSITARLLDDDMGIGWADATVDGPDGSWTGHLYAVWADPAQLFAVLSGDRAYEGWQFVASTIADAEIVGSDQWTGVMYQGEPPPFGPPPAPTAD